jgi:hypothetical protein
MRDDIENLGLPPAACARPRGTPSGRALARLLIAAALLHVSVTVAVFVAGRYALVPSLFDRDGVASSFASDGRLYMTEVRLLVEDLAACRPGAWLAAPYPLHAKLYSLCFAALGWLFGFTVLSAEPLNLACYLSILILVYRLGAETFDARAGQLAATVVALWPSFLLHTTQLLKDPLFIVAALALVAACARLLSGSLSWAGGVRAGTAGGGSVAAIWLIRSEMWPVALAVILIAAPLVAVRRLREAGLPAGCTAGTVLLVALALCVPFAVEPYRNPSTDSPAGRAIDLPPVTPECERRLAAARLDGQHAAPFTRLRARVVRSRVMATCAPAAGSNVDADVELNSFGDFALYLPRAVAVGFLAPMPRMWLASGAQVGAAGRVLGGTEMMLTYLLELAALGGGWAQRGRLTAWLLALSCAAGTTALGLAVPNIGTLYRLRYAFWMLLVVLAAGGALRFIFARARQRGEVGTVEAW